MSFLFGFSMSAQSLNIGEETKIPIYDKWGGTAHDLFLENGEIGCGLDVMKDDVYNKFIYNNQTHRKLLPHELEPFDAIPRVKISFGNLYFDNIKIKTNAFWIYKLHAAYYWNGGIIVVVNTSKRMFQIEPSDEIGFIDLQTLKCNIRVIIHSYFDRLIPDFIVPVTINTSSKDILFDVSIPEKMSILEKFECTISLTNKSKKPILVPDRIETGLGVAIYDRNVGNNPKYYLDGFNKKKHPDMPGKPGDKTYLLKPNETRKTTVSFPGKDFFRRRGRNHVRFFWEGFLNPDDKNEITRLQCEKWIEVAPLAPYRMNKSNAGLVFDVKIPEKIPINGKLDCTITMTNVSAEPILLPATLSDGLGAFSNGPRMYYDPKRERHLKLPDIPTPPENKYTMLLPSEKREDIVSFDIKSLIPFPDPWSLAFYWYGQLDPKDKYEITHLTCDLKWIEVTK